jgi:hypothetical protein
LDKIKRNVDEGERIEETLMTNHHIAIPEDCIFYQYDITNMRKIFVTWVTVAPKFDMEKKYPTYKEDEETVRRILNMKVGVDPIQFPTNYVHYKMMQKEHIKILQTGMNLLKKGVIIMESKQYANTKDLKPEDLEPLLPEIRTAAKLHGVTQIICIQGGMDVTFDMVSMLAGCNSYTMLVDMLLAKTAVDDESRKHILRRIAAERPDLAENFPQSLRPQIPETTESTKRPMQYDLKTKALQLLWNNARATTEEEFSSTEEPQNIKTYQGREIKVDFHKLSTTHDGKLETNDDKVFKEYNALYGKKRAETVLRAGGLMSSS